MGVNREGETFVFCGVHRAAGNVGEFFCKQSSKLLYFS